MNKPSARLAALLSLLAPAFAQAPDVIYHGGVVLTMNDAAPRAEAVAVKDGRIVAVGAEDAVLGTKGGATRVVDLGGSSAPTTASTSGPHSRR